MSLRSCRIRLGTASRSSSPWWTTYNLLSDLYYGFGGDHLFELLTNPVGFVQHIIGNFLANPLGVIANPFTLILSADDYPAIFYPLISPAIAPAFAIASVGSAGGLAGLAGSRR